MARFIQLAHQISWKLGLSRIAFDYGKFCPLAGGVYTHMAICFTPRVEAQASTIILSHFWRSG